MKRFLKNALLLGLLMTWGLIISLRLLGATSRFITRHEHQTAVPIGEGFVDPGGAWHANNHDIAHAPHSVVEIVVAYLQLAAPSLTRPSRRPVDP